MLYPAIQQLSNPVTFATSGSLMVRYTTSAKANYMPLLTAVRRILAVIIPSSIDTKTYCVCLLYSWHTIAVCYPDFLRTRLLDSTQPRSCFLLSYKNLKTAQWHFAFELQSCFSLGRRICPARDAKALSYDQLSNLAFANHK